MQNEVEEVTSTIIANLKKGVVGDRAVFDDVQTQLRVKRYQSEKCVTLYD